MKLKFPETLRLGVSTASMQIEGGQVNANWNDWYARGGIKDGTDPATANDHWRYWEEDTELMAAMGISHYRFSVEWARLCPTPHTVDEEAVARYRAELTLLNEKGIRPLLTIHHFSNPLWFENSGGFENRENLSHYLALVRLCVTRFGDLCNEYITINEPNVYAVNSFFFGEWPPAKRSLTATLRVMENLAYCHLAAYRIIHELQPSARVGCANHLRVFAPKNENNPWHRFCAKLNSYLFQDALTEAMTVGKFPFPLRNWGKIPRGEYTDFIGLNYYTRSTVAGIGDGVREDAPHNDLGWEIYPRGIVECARRLYDVLPRPIWVTENGTCDNDDRFRCRYLYEHLAQICESELPFERYYHWCFCDNFEWVEGNSAKFGLVQVDPATRERKVKRSGEFYSRLLRDGGVTCETYGEYVEKQGYNV